MKVAPTRIVRTDVSQLDALDLLVIGGGITGAAVAYDAARRGLRVALVERADFGGATSAATGKLVHGGLRYLKSFEIGLVRESLAERRILSTIAPNLVSPLPIVLPDPGLIEHAGLTAYDILSFDRNRIADASKHIPRHRSMRQSELSALGLPHVHSALLYHDGMMLSSERLTLAFLRSAAAAGAHVANYVEATSLIASGGRVHGAQVRDLVTGMTGSLRARVTVDATGPWSQELLSASPAGGPPAAVQSEGIYLVTRRMSDAMVLTVSSHGHFSVAPWRSRSLIGPTETPYHGPVSQWRLTRASIERFIAEINATSKLPLTLTMDDVLAAYGGLRPLSETTSTDTYNASRASEFVDHSARGAAGLVTATGGKYTTSRAFARRVVDGIAPLLGQKLAPSDTATVPLDGCAVADVTTAARQAEAQLDAAGLDASSAGLLTGLYGSDAPALIELAGRSPALREAVTDDGELLAGVAFAAEYEAPVHLSDILLRRTGIATLGAPSARVLEASATIAGDILGWDADRRAREIADARRATSLPED